MGAVAVLPARGVSPVATRCLDLAAARITAGDRGGVRPRLCASAPVRKLVEIPLAAKSSDRGKPGRRCDMAGK